ncbi:sugar O-acetyltransferase [Mycobacterium shimoidei]|uniref:sugar O-acetyltransferase n=1 Tax=Mycobacterium shimoidei TaxID=29313 RepID=UPI000848E48D|nr:sugar O-acetyltransferase [Mycobacterium shimoidei]MCV7261327.1 sugar O-acetyltransferase [Mycobacterium shimoidei]ODR07645.1 maltose acetyltransferase [Mycobacterium shimoidei]ORW83174.1 maltose acetyltransferase [Mycobacterium shimoidei]
MTSQHDRMLSGEPYRADDFDLVASRRACQRLLAEFNAAGADDDDARERVLHALLGSLGEGTVVLPRFLCDYGTYISIGARSFVNYDAIFLDCAPITIGDDVSIGPRVQLLTAHHPIDDHDARRQGWELASPITIGNNVWMGAGVIVCPGVSIGDDTVVGAGAVVTKDVPAHVVAAGNPCRVIRAIR